MALSWSHTVLLVRDREKMLDFYTRVLGFDITDQGPIPFWPRDHFSQPKSGREHHQIGMDASPGQMMAHPTVTPT